MGYDQRFSRRKVGCKVFKYLKLNKVLFFFAQDSRAGLEFIMIRISQLRLPCGYAAGALENKIGKTLRMEGRSLTYTIVRHSVDARKKPQLFDTYTVDVDTGLGPGGEAALLKRLKNRSLTRKRSLALREFSLGMESLDRFVMSEPLYRVHECVFGVLALESEPVDPRL